MMFDFTVVIGTVIGFAALAVIAVIIDRKFDERFAPKKQRVKQAVKRQLPDCFVWDIDCGEDFDKALLMFNK